MSTSEDFHLEEGRAIILCVNKWDATFIKNRPAKSKKDFSQTVRDELKFLEYAPIAFLSARAASAAGFVAHLGAAGLVVTADLVRFAPALAFRVAPPAMAARAPAAPCGQP